MSSIFTALPSQLVHRVTIHVHEWTHDRVDLVPEDETHKGLVKMYRLPRSGKTRLKKVFWPLVFLNENLCTLFYSWIKVFAPLPMVPARVRHKFWPVPKHIFLLVFSFQFQSCQGSKSTN